MELVAAALVFVLLSATPWVVWAAQDYGAFRGAFEADKATPIPPKPIKRDTRTVRHNCHVAGNCSSYFYCGVCEDWCGGCLQTDTSPMICWDCLRTRYATKTIRPWENFG